MSTVSGAIDTRIVEVTSDGQIVINTETLSTALDISIEITVSSKKNRHDTTSATTNFVISIGNCPADFTSAVSADHELSFFLRSKSQQLATFEAQDQRPCTRTYFVAKLNGIDLKANDQPPSLFSFDTLEQQGQPSKATLNSLQTDNQTHIG